MKTEMILDENYCLSHYEVTHEHGATKTIYTINPGDCKDDLIHIDQVIYLGGKEIFKDDFLLDPGVLNIINEIMGGCDGRTTI